MSQYCVCLCVCACTCISLCITPFESVIMYVQPCVCVCIPVCCQLIHPSACMTSPSKLFISVQALPAWIICLPYKYLNAHRSLICTDTVCLQSTTPRTNIHTKLLPLPQWNITNVVDGVSCLQLDVVQTIIHKNDFVKTTVHDLILLKQRWVNHCTAIKRTCPEERLEK